MALVPQASITYYRDSSSNHGTPHREYHAGVDGNYSTGLFRNCVDRYWKRSPKWLWVRGVKGSLPIYSHMVERSRTLGYAQEWAGDSEMTGSVSYRTKMLDRLYLTYGDDNHRYQKAKINGYSASSAKRS